MTTYKFDVSELQKLKGKTILITGASTGIGRATAQIAHASGANIVIGDWNVDEGRALVEELKQKVLFQKTDVTKWEDVLALFEAAHQRFGVIHAVLSNAGINSENLLDTEFDKETGALLPPNLKSLDVNLVGTLYMVKVALYYFEKWPQIQSQIVLTASAASFIDTPPLHVYCAGKAGVLGLMRSLRTQVIKKNATINVIAPWLTVTPMLLPALLDIWGTLPANKPAGVAHALLLPVVRPDVNGKAFFVAGHEIVDFEDKLHETQPLWMGKQLSEDVDEGQRRLIP
ncbi:NAD(P)-binding protein [Mollisia scopiformis]|uniref:NAD(P)-binding protein n=1 Tax=Mollisia scopiformis TaxID=149040 RepID=A0A194WZH8_MOLSC|nr:NAD(P)-binding protein [Mollisia scopiformis]KUJ13356.1 NAD(P)-binding protein [Mollisia scopiformis]